MSYYHFKNCIAVLRRLCITVRRRAIALTYYFEAAGSRWPGGDHGVLVFFIYVLLVLCVVLCTKFFLCVLLVLFVVLCSTK
jgi:hypothetical protein